VRAPRLWSRGGHQGEALSPGVTPIPPKGRSADIPEPIPDAWIQTNHYAREMFDRLWAVAEAAENYYAVARPEGIADLEARLHLRWTLKRLHGDL
jgi:hypothetical protein